jgi:hypothetical protein
MMVGSRDKLQSETGYIDARPHPPDRRNLLQRTAGPYIGSRPTKLMVSKTSPLNSLTADIRADVVFRRFGPCVDGSGLARRIFTSQVGSVQPCVRPFGAVHMTAGHNALRGSGPGHNLAFDNALARVGCPNRRIDRLCITFCSPSQPSHHVGCPARSRYAASAAGSL